MVWPVVTGAGVLSTTAVVGIASATIADSGPNVWTALEKGSWPMVVVLALAFLELLRRYDRKEKTLAGKDATILAMSERHAAAAEAAVSIAKSQMETAVRTERLLGQLVAIHRGSPAGAE